MSETFEVFNRMADQLKNMQNRLAALERQEQLRKLQLKAADVVSSSTVTLGRGNFFDVSGAATINYITTTGWTAGTIIFLRFLGAATLAHNSGAVPANTLPLFLPDGVNVTTAADDVAMFILDETHWRLVGGTTGIFSVSGTDEAITRFNGTSALQDSSAFLRNSGLMEITLLNAETTDGSPTLIISHNSSGTPTTEFSVVLQAKAKTNTTNNTLIGALKWLWSVVTHAVRRSALAGYGNYQGDEIQLFNFESPDYLPTAPNARGEGSVDLQSGRYSGGDRVASGYASVLGGGEDNLASNDYGVNCGGVQNEVPGDTAVNVGGNQNVISGDNAANVGGNQNEVSGSAAANVGGAFNEVSGEAAFNGGGSSNEVSGQSAANAGGAGNILSGDFTAAPGGTGNLLEGDLSSCVGGNSGRATLVGQHIHSVASFATPGDGQLSRLPLYAESINTTPVIMTLDLGSAIPILQNNELWSFEGRVIGRKTNTSIQHAEYKIEGLIYRNANAASTTLARSVVTTLFEDDAAWNVALTADTTNGALRVTVTGVTNVQWMGFIEVVSTLIA